jgi:hypothetical protein
MQKPATITYRIEEKIDRVCGEDILLRRTVFNTGYVTCWYANETVLFRAVDRYFERLCEYCVNFHNGEERMHKMLCHVCASEFDKEYGAFLDELDAQNNDFCTLAKDA